MFNKHKDFDDMQDCEGRRGWRFMRRWGRHGGHQADHGRHHGGGRLGRFFAHGDLRLVVLNLIGEKPRHGYEIIKAIEDSVGGAYSPSPGVIYPTLAMLEDQGYVTVAAEGGKKLYAITDDGKAFLDANRQMLDALSARMSETAHKERAGAAPQVVRAMENLKLALRLRMSAGEMSEAQIDAIAAAIDAAARAVEKV